MEKVFEVFNRTFSSWNISLPRKVKDNLYPGALSKQGWNIQYTFGRDERARYMDYYASHRMTSDIHTRIYENGEQEDLPAGEEFMLIPANATEEECKQIEREFLEHNQKIYEQMSLKYCGVTSAEFDALVAHCQVLPPAKGDYLINDYVENLLLTVIDFRLQTTTVIRAMKYYRENSREAVRTYQDLVDLLNSYPDDKEGNLQVAQRLWGYKLWNRVVLLRSLLLYFAEGGVTTQAKLISWAETTEFEDFHGRVKGIAFTLYKWLLMRLGVEGVKPDIWVQRFVHDTIGRNISNRVIANVLQHVANQLNIKAYKLDWSIWEYQRSLPRRGTLKDGAIS